VGSIPIVSTAKTLVGALAKLLTGRIGLCRVLVVPRPCHNGEGTWASLATEIGCRDLRKCPNDLDDGFINSE
jgi:hypothetical protein